ncbi:lysozyme inhibitor LprI family protein [Bacillus sp. JCM 19034]|uniref:lysozyme inhibitor LprI family protein n=1 Tax=Bacillus sp. JCM 19034 TaxID=1481928 RepID=UPI000A8F8CAD|nr:lysozyme inhibitor LprI family protein [Bacillus sp. JCM 19034]
MKRKIAIAIISLVLVILYSGCVNTTEDSMENESLNTDSYQDTKDDTVDEDSTESEVNSDNSLTDIVDTVDSSKDEPSVEGDSSTNTTTSMKDDYLKKLNKMEEDDRNEEAKSTVVELEEQETERYTKWDKELNEIYKLLEEQLSKEQMDSLREEQRDWITSRDETAKEASLKYEGGSTESLEYVATQASLTRERCYELVASYME